MYVCWAGHQLAQLGLSSTDTDLRKNAVKELMENKVDSSQFLCKSQVILVSFFSHFPHPIHPNTGEMLSDPELHAYCIKMASTPAWVSQVELQATATVLKRPI